MSPWLNKHQNINQSAFSLLTSQPSIWGGYDGASLTNRLLSSEFDNALLLLSSFSNPCNTIAHAQQLGYRCVLCLFLKIPRLFVVHNST